MEDHALYSAPGSLKLSDGMVPSPSVTRHIFPTEMTYKMTDAEVQEFVKLKATNGHLFNGRRNSSKLAWRTILKEMDLQGKMSDWQAMKKWENLRNKYKELKNPPPGATVPVFEWRWFKLMDDAMEGRLKGSAKVLSITSALTSSDEFLPRKPRKRHVAVLKNTEAAGGGEAEVLVNTDDFWGIDTSEQMQMMECDRQEVEQERAQLDSDRLMVDREREVLERERMVLERERAGLQREQATLERDRASLERARASVERDRAELDRRTAQLEAERGKLDREKLDLHRDTAAFGKDGSSTAETNGEASPPQEAKERDLDATQVAKRQRFLDLFEKLIEKF
ncbi:hypothetical protein ACEWY4_002186 [Coilia grayii]|uniref:Myb/SANT-like DNA-binding domain-containing protein n=1 Tax=Coilia grayii TaxID=363190 RepID=A0ABD1KV31_9TELE